VTTTAEPNPSPTSPALVERCKALIAKRTFDIAILVVIVINAVILGLETFAPLSARHQG